MKIFSFPKKSRTCTLSGFFCARGLLSLIGFHLFSIHEANASSAETNVEETAASS